MLVSNELGGAGLIALKLTAALREREYQTHVWIPGEGPALAEAYKMGLDYRLYNPTAAFTSSKIQNVLYNWKIGKLLGDHAPGVIHVHSPNLYAALRLALGTSGFKSVAHVHLEEG